MACQQDECKQKLTCPIFISCFKARYGRAGFMEKVFAVGFTDSVHSLGYNTPRDVREWFIKVSNCDRI